MYSEQRTIDHILATYTANVREVAIRVMLEYGFTGLDIRENNDGPKSLNDLAYVFADLSTKKFPVNAIGSDKTVFTDKTVNYLFRAWHDIGHFLLEAPFDEFGERQVAAWQASYLKGIDREILKADVIDQYVYYADTGKFVDDQRSFVIEKVFGKNGALPPATPEFKLAA